MSEDKRYRDHKWLYEQYVGQNLVSSEIAEKCGCSERTIQRWLKRHDIETRTGGSVVADCKIEYPQLRDKEWLKSQYINKKKTAADIAKIIGCSKSAVQKWLNTHGIQTKTNSERTPDNLKDKEWLREQYVYKEKTGYEIADELGCGHTTVYSWIRKHGIDQQHNGKVSGEDHWWYSGGSEPYGEGWNVRKKKKVRRRDSHTCQNPKCCLSQREHLNRYGERLHVHHLRKAKTIDDPKERNSMENLITLCRDCHRRWEKMADADLVPQGVTP